MDTRVIRYDITTGDETGGDETGGHDKAEDEIGTQALRPRRKLF